MKINRVKWLIALIIAMPVTLYAVPNTDPVDPANVEDVFLNAFEKIKAGAPNTRPETNENSTATPTPAHPKSTVAPVKSGVMLLPSSTAGEHTTSVSYPSIPVKKTSSIGPVVTHAPATMQSTQPVSDQHIQSELADLRSQNAALQTRVSTMSQQVTQLQQALVESQKLLSKDLNTLESAALSPHKPAAQPAIHTASVVVPSPKALPQTVKAGITLPSPQFSQTLPAAIPPSQQLPAVENAPVSAAVVAPTPVPGIDVSAPATNNQESASTEGQEESMPKNFLDSTMFLLVIGVVLMAVGLLLLIWLLWPRSRQQVLPETQTPPPPQSPELESEPEFFQQEQAEQPAIVEPDTEIHDYTPMKVSELENFEQLIEEEQEYLSPGQESESEDREYSFMDTKDAIPVKLDLARAYLEMGDYEAVNDTLKTVLAEGSKAQQREAELLLEQARLAQGD